jgi:hypothetical protein
MEFMIDLITRWSAGSLSCFGIAKSAPTASSRSQTGQAGFAPAGKPRLCTENAARRLVRFLLRPRMRLVIYLGQMLKVQMGIDLRRRQAGVAEHFLHRTQIAG